MQDLMDKLHLSLKDDPKLAEYLSKKQPGDECEFTIRASIDEQNKDFATLSVKDVTVKLPAGEYAPGDEPKEPDVVEWASNQTKSSGAL